METIELDNAPTRVWRQGAGAPLVFLHGIERHMAALPFLQKLAETYEVIAPELPGFGDTGGADNLEDIADLVLKMRRVLSTLAEDGPVTLIGHSLGGMFAAEIAAFCPDLVERLVLVNSYGFWMEDHPMPDYFVMQEDALNAALWSTKDAERIASLRGAFMEETDRNIGENRAAATRFMWPLPDRGLRRRLGYITAPTLVLHGTDDGLIPEAHAKAMADAIPGARYVPIRDAGHYPMIEAEDDCLSEVRAFLSE
ncbi:MAG: alpha/beta fold hydrolase [Sagittula sp.]|uniref:alpha/beta fold hydrolase n=1 Tax=Rhodobacterales TaxID=204455 RepID=UPI004059980D